MEKKMMGFSWSFWVLGLVFLVLITTNSVLAETEVTCEECIFNFVSFCKPYLVGEEAKPSSNCCIGLSNTFGGITKHKTRKTICECLHRIAVRDGYKRDRAKKINKLCNVNFPVPLAPTAEECKNIK